MILAIETATDVCSVAFENKEGEVFEKRTESRGSHSEKLFLSIKALMEEHDFSIDELSAVLVSEGPGSYTGLRIAASGVKGLLFGTDVPLYGISTLASFAVAAQHKVPSAPRIHAIIDARRVHVYHQQFEVKSDCLHPKEEVQTIPIELFEQMVLPDDVITGAGIERFDQEITENTHCFGSKNISAQSLIKLYHQEGTELFIERVSPDIFDPKYYTSNQVNK